MTFRLVYDDGQEFTVGRVVDLSATGMLVQGPAPAKVGSLLSLVPIGEAGDILFDAKAKVVRVMELAGPVVHYRIGLDFRSMDRRSRRALARLAAEMPQTDDLDLVPDLPPPSEEGFGGTVEHHRIRERITVPIDPRRTTPPL